MLTWPDKSAMMMSSVRFILIVAGAAAYHADYDATAPVRHG
jgi:hypothetical protein